MLNILDIMIAVKKAFKVSKAYTDSKTEGLSGGINYKGSVPYYTSLPADPETGDAYTVKYAGTTGTVPDGTEYVWEFDTDLQEMAWIDWSKDCYTKAEADANLNAVTAALTTEIAKVGATFKGIFTSQEALDAAAADENDVAILQTTDANGNVFYTINTYKGVEPVGNLPEGYTQLLYIQSSGTQYIDTGVNLSSSRGFYMKFMPLALENNTAFFGLEGFDNRSYSVNYKLEISNYDMYFRYVDQFRVDTAINEISEVDFKPRILSVNGMATTVTDEGEWYFSGTNTAALFAYKYGSGFFGKSSMCLYECKMYDSDNTTLLRHFIPVRNSSNEVGLYDIVEGRFYGNDGTGSFTAGPSADGYWTANYTVMHSADGKQNVIDSSHKLSSDFVDDTNKTHKFATQEQLEQINTNKNNISLLETNISTLSEQVGYAITTLEGVL